MKSFGYALDRIVSKTELLFPRRDAPTSPLVMNGSEMPSAGIALS
jgi:hypothetical protein